MLLSKLINIFRPSIKIQLYEDSDLGKIRERLSFQYIKGTGIEIGALHYPLPVANGVVVRYVDRIDRDQSIANFPELDSSKIVKPDIIADGFTLSSIPASSQDFLIANHVLEHASNPIQVLLNWSRLLKPKGVIFVSVPIAEKCFDKGRPTTALQHFIDDFNLCRQNKMDDFRKRNRVHYEEWITISEPNILTNRQGNYKKPDSDEIQARIDMMSANADEIHFHTFTSDSFKNLIYYFTSRIDRSLKLIEMIETAEVVAILRKRYFGF